MVCCYTLPFSLFCLIPVGPSKVPVPGRCSVSICEWMITSNYITSLRTEKVHSWVMGSGLSQQSLKTSALLMLLVQTPRLHTSFFLDPVSDNFKILDLSFTCPHPQSWWPLCWSPVLDLRENPRGPHSPCSCLMWVSHLCSCCLTASWADFQFAVSRCFCILKGLCQCVEPFLLDVFTRLWVLLLTKPDKFTKKTPPATGCNMEGSVNDSRALNDQCLALVSNNLRTSLWKVVQCWESFMDDDCPLMKMWEGV